MSKQAVKSLTIGVVASSGGGAIINAYEIYNSIYPDKLTLLVATDRPCGIEGYCESNNISYQRFENSDNTGLSEDIQSYFTKQGGVDALLLFFLRLITTELFSVYPSLNIHPSLLPDFPSFNPLRQALKAGASEIGATIHMADDRIDGGDILVQISQAIDKDLTEVEAESLSFCQKTYLVLVFLSALSQDKVIFERREKNGFVFKHEKNLFEGTGAHLKALDANLDDAYRKKMTEMGYHKWLI